MQIHWHNDNIYWLIAYHMHYLILGITSWPVLHHHLSVYCMHLICGRELSAVVETSMKPSKLEEVCTDLFTYTMLMQ